MRNTIWDYWKVALVTGLGGLVGAFLSAALFSLLGGSGPSNEIERAETTVVLNDPSVHQIESLAQHRSLEELRIYSLRNDPEDALRVIQELTELRELEISSSPALSDKNFGLTHSPAQLQVLKIRSCISLSPDGLMWLVGSANLQVLDLTGCSSIDDRLIHIVETLPELRELSLEDTSVTEPALKEIVRRSERRIRIRYHSRR